MRGLRQKIDRGVTLLDGKGWYSKQEKLKVLVVWLKTGITRYLPVEKGY